ncbi:hypothetical protein PHMEG_00014724 [Phytophthora megakarya]|uniref:HTH myb-type domain-containing protein n=1 Tax=Phytophthora megakarya TaxID=4795 RepID=A0A225W4M5_9STRA|nr:hypothetical protein PHMEG_00014724 [Phytophthora megakarya]
MDQARCPSPTSTDVFTNETTQASTRRPRKKHKRPSKRFLWQEDLHLRFVAAIFDLGLKNASPKLLLPLMNKTDPEPGLTTEHVKSHLQKYRMNYERSRREFKEICKNEVKRDRKKRRREERNSDTFVSVDSTSQDATDSGPGCENASGGMSVTREVVPAAYLPMQQSSNTVMDSSSIPELPDAQWCTFNMLMSGPSARLSIQAPEDTQIGEVQVQEELMQMHQAMQAQMNFHRQMLTRKVALASGLYPNWNGDYYRQSVREPDPNAFQQMWTSTQQIHQRQLATHRLQQQQLAEQISSQQYVTTVPEMPSSALPSGSLPTLIDRPLDDTVDVDLNHWDPFNVGLEDDELFDFLKA